MNVKEIIDAHLKQVGATGLCKDECGCEMPHLMPCYWDVQNCVPAVRKSCEPNCDNCGGRGCMVPVEKE